MDESLARTALSHYPLGKIRLQLLGSSFNTLFRVSSPAGQCILRVGPHCRVHPEGGAGAEALWTDELARAGLQVPRVIRTHAGSPSVTLEGHECTLLSWTPGRRPGQMARQLGELSARLHAASLERSTKPTGVLDGRSALHFACANLLEEFPHFRAALKQAQHSVDRVWEKPVTAPRLLHADLTFDNVVLSRTGLLAIDFQDLTWGYPEQDLANTLFSLPTAQHEAFREGYRSIRDWPEVEPGLLLARRVALVNLALTARRPGFEAEVERHAKTMRS